MSLQLSRAYARGSPAAQPSAELEATLRRVVAAARAAWPDVEITDQQLVTRLGEHARERAGWLPDDVAASELLIAAAIADGDSRAIRRFEERYFPIARAAARRCGAVDDVIQRLRTRLFLANDGTPRVLAYAGDGRLAGLVRVTATRLALNLARDRGRERARHEPPPADALHDAVDDPELQLAKRSHQRAFKAAFESAIDALEPRDRTLLRLHLLDHLSIDDIALIYGSHRATAARWLTKARERVADHTRRQLQAALPEEELQAALALVRSRLDLSLSRVLRSREDDHAR